MNRQDHLCTSQMVSAAGGGLELAEGAGVSRGRDTGVEWVEAANVAADQRRIRGDHGKWPGQGLARARSLAASPSSCRWMCEPPPGTCSAPKSSIPYLDLEGKGYSLAIADIRPDPLAFHPVRSPRHTGHNQRGAGNTAARSSKLRGVAAAAVSTAWPLGRPGRAVSPG